jgi:hypothetical protein
MSDNHNSIFGYPNFQFWVNQIELFHWRIQAERVPYAWVMPLLRDEPPIYIAGYCLHADVLNMEANFSAFLPVHFGHPKFSKLPVDRSRSLQSRVTYMANDVCKSSYAQSLEN